MDNQTCDDELDRRTCLRTIGAVGATGAVVGLSSAGATAQQEPVTAEFCGDFQPGPQAQQCIQCVELECPDEEVFPLALFTNLRGQCIEFDPDEIPDDAEFITLKAGTRCHVAPVDGATEFCLPQPDPELSNATFYRCGGEPTPMVETKKVTCAQIEIFTENIPGGETLTVTVIFESGFEQQYEVLVDADGTAVVDLPGNLNPSRVIIFYQNELLDEQDVIPVDGPCDAPPKKPKKKGCKRRRKPCKDDRKKGCRGRGKPCKDDRKKGCTG